MRNEKSRNGYFRSRRNEGIAFISLWLAGFLIFRLFPSVFSLIVSFSDLKLFGGIKKWGLMNYSELLSDHSTYKAFAVTLKYALITVPLRTAAGLCAALLLNRSAKGISFFRTVFYIPSVLGSSVAMAILWKIIFRDDGTANAIISAAGFFPVKWLAGENSALSVISLLRIWQFGSVMVIFLAALRSVPPELCEAAEIDGAGRTRRFFSITVPFLTPALFYNLVTQTGLAMQEFNAPFIITQGGPRGATTTISLLIYNTAFQIKDMGTACALTWIFLILVSVLCSFIFISQKYWVFYSGDSQEDV